MLNKNIKKFYQHSNKQYYYLPHAIGHGAPTTIPEDAGLMYIDIDSGNAYVSTAKSQVSDWKMITGGSGGSLLLQTNSTNNADQTLLDLQEGTGITLTDNGTGGVIIETIAPVPNVIFTPGQPVNLASWTTITNFIIPVSIGKSYTFKAVILYTVANAATDGSSWAVNGNGHFSVGSYICTWNNAAGIYSEMGDTGTTPNPTLDSITAKNNTAIIEGTFSTADTSGTISIDAYFTSTGFSSPGTILPGSMLTYYEI